MWLNGCGEICMLLCDISLVYWFKGFFFLVFCSFLKFCSSPAQASRRTRTGCQLIWIGQWRQNERMAWTKNRDFFQFFQWQKMQFSWKPFESCFCRSREAAITLFGLSREVAISPCIRQLPGLGSSLASTHSTLHEIIFSIVSSITCAFRYTYLWQWWYELFSLATSLLVWLTE